MSAAAGLAARLRAEGGPLAGSLAPRPPASPRAEGLEGARALAVAAIAEAYELHHGEPSLVLTADADLALLAGDRLYALGLAELAGAGDLAAVRAMAAVIARAAAARAAGDPAEAERAWSQGLGEMAHGSIAPGPGDR